jgi:hypothetical protein
VDTDTAGGFLSVGLLVCVNEKINSTIGSEDHPFLDGYAGADLASCDMLKIHVSS